MPIPLLALALSAFAIGTTEFVIMGLLPDVARDLSVSIPSAGLLVSGYALGVAAGAPVLAILTSRMPRKAALQALMLVFIAGNVLCAVAGDYRMLMLARVVTSFAHGSFFGIGAVVAASLVVREKQASAIALMFTGLTLANVLGVPFGTFVGQSFGWRLTFWIVAGLGVLSLGGITALLPNRRDSGPVGLAREMRVLKEPQVWLALAMTVLGFGGVFVVFTYIAPILEQVSGFSPRAVT
ncbi:MAG: MFS transporter, partial [Burkholderiales bacterium]|nr:MFS transporter [Burkholderiales bacterium]